MSAPAAEDSASGPRGAVPTAPRTRAGDAEGTELAIKAVNDAAEAAVAAARRLIVSLLHAERVPVGEMTELAAQLGGLADRLESRVPPVVSRHEGHAAVRPGLPGPAGHWIRKDPEEGAADRGVAVRRSRVPVDRAREVEYTLMTSGDKAALAAEFTASGRRRFVPRATAS